MINFSTLKIYDDTFFDDEFSSTMNFFNDELLRRSKSSTMNFSALNFSRQQNIFRAPKNREASISLYRCRVNAKDMLLAKKKSSAIDRGIGATFDFLKKI